MQTNTLSDIIDFVKDISGQTNLSIPKAIRALNFAVDHYTYLALTSSGRWKWDSTNQIDLSRISTVIDSTTPFVTLEADTITVSKVEILEGGKYQVVNPTDVRDSNIPLDSEFGEGVPYYYDFDGRILRIFPVSDSSRTLRVTIGRAHPRFTASDLNVGIGVMPIHEEYIALYAADRIMLGMSDSARAEVRNELTIKESEIRDMFSKRDQASPRRIKSKIPSVFMQRSRAKRY